MHQHYVAVGRMTKDPELIFTGNGTPVVNFTLAINEKNNKVTFLPCVAWKENAKNLKNIAKKGFLLLIEGKVKTYTHEKEDGVSDTYLTVEVKEWKLISKTNKAKQEEINNVEV